MSMCRVWYYKWVNADTESEIFKQLYGSIVAKKGRILPDYDDVRYNGSLMLGNSHIITGDNIALPQNYKHVGGYHIKDTVEPLPQHLKEIFDNSSNGVIYFSLGSNLKSSALPESIKRELINMFSELKETVIWKFEKFMPDLPKNVHIIKWVSQQSVLAHPNCKLFITHGGLLSKLEALHAGKPIIGVPFFADQYINVNRAVAKGFGKRVNFGTNIAHDLRIAIKEILENQSYQQRAKELSKIFHDRTLPPGKELVYWIEHVIRTNGAPHMRSTALNFRWYQKLYLDLLFVIVIVILLLFIVSKHVTAMVRKEFRSKQKTK
ncbi:UDP-glucosyltransferase 2-like [Melitaea cinxia]|uniref:UDP-glucosyltransferase 2-like n=1 Tax=Melitaea cinxia TaxID=113334 RepID=UPI001E272CEC|nr:UDP-glucosyltransferase 2-like [Melitaea cinxia]